MSCPITDSTAPDYQGFTLDELDKFGMMSGPNALPFSLDHEIWKDRSNRPLILAAIEERHG